MGIFTAYRDRQITKQITKTKGQIRVLKSRNIGSNKIVNIPDYDSYVDEYKNLSIAKYINHDEAVLVPNLTYNPRACFLPEKYHRRWFCSDSYTHKQSKDYKK